MKREGKDGERERGKKKLWWVGGSRLHYLQLQKFSSSKMTLPRKRLGYDARISSSISQVESS